MNLAKHIRRFVGASKPRHPGNPVRLEEIPQGALDFDQPSVERFFAVVRMPVAKTEMSPTKTVIPVKA